MDPNFPYVLAPAPLREQRRMQLRALAQRTPAQQEELDALTARQEQAASDQQRKWALEQIEQMQGLDAAQQHELDAIRKRNAADLAAEQAELNARFEAWGQKPPFPMLAPEPPPLPAGVLPFVKTPRKKRR